MTGPILVS